LVICFGKSLVLNLFIFNFSQAIWEISLKKRLGFCCRRNVLLHFSFIVVSISINIMHAQTAFFYQLVLNVNAVLSEQAK
jgi:hypothetical protein